MTAFPEEIEAGLMNCRSCSALYDEARQQAADALECLQLHHADMVVSIQSSISLFQIVASELSQRQAGDASATIPAMEARMGLLLGSAYQIHATLTTLHDEIEAFARAMSTKPL